MRSRFTRWLSVLACPTCGGSLHEQGVNVLRCPACPQQFTAKKGILSLIPEREEARLESLSKEYGRARRAEGWQPMTRHQLLALPKGSPQGYPPLYWQVRRQTFESFIHFLKRVGPGPEEGPAADVGAGTGWLAYRLARSGYDALALDASLDEDFGLGASMQYRAAFPERLLPVRADLDLIPLQQASYGLIVFNASIHYTRHLETTLHRAAQSLRPDGCVAILDTPVARQSRPGSGAGDRHLGHRELDRAMRAAGLQARSIKIRRGLRWQAYQLRAALRGAARFSFPMVIGFLANGSVRDGGA